MWFWNPFPSPQKQLYKAVFNRDSALEKWSTGCPACMIKILQSPESKSKALVAQLRIFWTDHFSLQTDDYITVNPLLSPPSQVNPLPQISPPFQGKKVNMFPWKKWVLMIYNGNWTEWSAIWSEIIRVISKSNERAARVRFEITSMISDQNCTTRSSITTLLHPFWNYSFF